VIAEAQRLGVGEEVDDFARFDPALACLPEIWSEQFGVVAEEELSQLRVAE
jgi:hypothetical protein